MKSTRVYDLKGKREITIVDFKDNIVAYRDCLILGETTYNSRYGFCYKDELDSVTNESLEPIKSKLDDYSLYNNEIKELHLKHKIDKEYFEKLSEYEVTSPFEFISRHPEKIDTLGLYKFSHKDHHLRDINGDTLPRAVFFGYMLRNGAVTDKYYKLNELREYLSENDRISFLHEGISSIDYFNRSDGESRCLYFIYSPTKEIHDKISDIHPFLIYSELKPILGFDKYEK